MRESRKMAGALTVFSKEIGDHVGSKRYIILFALILILSIMSAYQGVDFIRNNPNAGFMAIFTSARYGFSFVYLMVFFGPIIGLALSFDAINKERTSGSLSTLLSQPIYRDSVINGKFIAGTAALSLLAVSTIAIMCGVAVSFLGFGPTMEDVSRIILFALLTVLYLTFWLGLGLLYSTVTKKTSTSMLMSIATWLFCSVVITIVAMLVANALAPVSMPMGAGANATRPFESPEYRERLRAQFTIQTSIQRISPAYLYNEAASSILGMAGRTFGFIGPGGGTPYRQLELTQGLLTSWPQIVALAVSLIVCFAISYMLFLRLEIRPGG
jgi:ABC-2 type transport system permease protein